ncbi:MAG: UPF0176 protein [Candidatus Paceibacteria bacterium]|jgi:UPF0176 protein
MDKLHVAALYKFVALPDYDALRDPLLEVCLDHNVKGTLLLAPEGINGTIAGAPDAVKHVLDFLQEDARLAGLEIKFSTASEAPFLRMKVRRKQEIVTMGVPGIDPTQSVGTYVDPADWNQLLEDPDVLVIDTRNDYEVAIGTFKGAKNPRLSFFRDFPAWLREEFASGQKPKVAMFCTGGIRCEKSTAFLKGEGLQEVYHLKGGILKYLENVAQEESLWEGECFVFDERVSVAHGLRRGTYDLCRACRRPINEEHRLTSEFVEGVSCPHCFHESTEQQRASFIERTRQITLARSRGESHMKEVADTSRGTASWNVETQPTLYSFRRCPYAMRARLALASSQQQWIHREVELRNRPQQLYSVSSKGTVPVLELENGTVIDESLEIMLWTLGNRDPEGWLLDSDASSSALALIARCDGEFKHHLDRYKYSDRYPGSVSTEHRSAASAFLLDLEQRLCTSSHLFGQQVRLADMAIAPFVRQFAAADRAWFEAQPWPRLLAWLADFQASDRFQSVMTKFVAWEPESCPVLVEWDL